MIEEILIRGWDNFIARTTGPMNFRFLIQPAIAVLLAVRSGLKDAREKKPPFFWALLSKRKLRRPLIQAGARDLSRVFILAVMLDFTYQLIMQKGVYMLELLFTAILLAVVPYLLVRGPLNRFLSYMHRDGESESDTQVTTPPKEVT